MLTVLSDVDVVIVVDRREDKEVDVWLKNQEKS